MLPASGFSLPRSQLLLPWPADNTYLDLLFRISQKPHPIIVYYDDDDDDYRKSSSSPPKGPTI